MHEITGDLFESEKADAICILTNGFVNAQGANTMGKGCAGEAKRRWPGIQMVVGAHLKRHEIVHNDCRILTTLNDFGEVILEVPPAFARPVIGADPSIRVCGIIVPYHILTFPTKYHWSTPSDLQLIRRSCTQLMTHADAQGWNSVVLPRPGCGAGGLSWEDEVRPLISQILDQRFWVITFR